MTLDLSRWQFAVTTIYHFLFVPITIGLSFLVAILQTIWYRTGKDEYRRLAHFFGPILLINVAIGVVTGLVMEFEFGMNWSAYSKEVGNVFGGPLAMEGLLAFFLESTFLGLWVFGWNRLSRRVHLACIWMVSLGTAVSAAFIMMANSWMQHPVGYVMVDGKPELNDVWALFTNPVFLWAYVHVLLASLVTGSLVMLSISAWQLRRKREVDSFRRAATAAMVVLIPASILILFVGSELGVIEARYQPMKIAAAEAQWTTCQPCSFSIFQIGGGKDDKTPTQILEVPHVLSLLATNSWNGEVVGLNQLQAQYVKEYGPGTYVPNVFIQYWSMRVMAYLGSLVFLLALWGLWLLHRRKLERSKWFLIVASWAVITPFLMNTAGWLLTENGRQPWIVQGLMKTANGLSPSISASDVWISIIAFAAIYLVLGVADGYLMVHYGRRHMGEPETDVPGAGGGHEAGEEEREGDLELVY